MSLRRTFTAMPNTQELNELRNTLVNALGTINQACNRTNNDELELDTAAEESIAQVGDRVEIVVNPDTPEEEIIEGELVGVLDDAVEEEAQTVLVRTLNGRVRKARLPKTVKISNSRKDNRLTVKTGNKGSEQDLTRSLVGAHFQRS